MINYFNGTKEHYNLLESNNCILYFWNEFDYCCKLNNKEIDKLILFLNNNKNNIILFIIDINNNKIKNFIYQFGITIIPSIIITTNKNNKNNLKQIYNVDNNNKYNKINCYEFINFRLTGYSQMLIIYNILQNNNFLI